MAANKDEDNGWHLDKRVSVGHIVTTAVVIVSFVVWANTLDKRIALNENAIKQNEKQIELQREQTAQVYSGLHSELEKINDKLDKFIFNGVRTK